jgi:hypothetical protein
MTIFLVGSGRWAAGSIGGFARIARIRGFNRRIQCQQIGLEGNFIKSFDYFSRLIGG